MLQLAFGAAGMVLPGSYGDSTLQLRMVVALVLAALAAGTLHSAMGGWEAAAGPRLRRAERRQLLAAAALVTALSGAAESAVAGAGGAAAVVRALLTWWGLAVLSGRLLGRQQSWVLPTATVFPLSYLGWDATGALRWWNWLWAPPSSLPCWALAAVSLLLGALAWWLTPWRLRALRRRLR
ncbi:hypothetical protein ACWEPB_11495 [Kitasatospora cineracea]|uniref:hypothetical protein n=1 Tax=Kitasatospora cineracea TaxID=88074 RepID=UPI0033E19B74